MADAPVRGILGTVGNTPLAELDRLSPGRAVRVFAKLERFNPGGSVKDRSAQSMLQDKIASGELIPGRSVVVESSSGNLAVGLAQTCRYFGLRFICVVDAKTTEHNLKMLRAFDAEVEVVGEPDPATGEYLPERIRRVRSLVAADPNAYWPNQYANPLNPSAHHRTMREIVDALDGKVDYLLAATSTVGTLRGCGDYVRQRGMSTKIIAVDAVGSVIFGQEPQPRLIPGHGASMVPPLLDRSLVTEAVHVTDLDCVVACRRLARTEAILAGGSSGATVAALGRLAPRIEDGSNCVLIFPDGGDRYLDTIYSDEWVAKHFGEVAHLWKGQTETEPATC